MSLTYYIIKRESKLVVKILDIFSFFLVSPVTPDPVSQLTVLNQARNRIAAGVASFENDGSLPNCTDQTYSDLAFGKRATITIPTKCLPLIKVTATVNSILCDPFVGGQKLLPININICAPVPGSISNCYVVVNENCKQ